VRSVAHHQPPPGLVTLVDEPGDVVVDLGLQRLGQHPPRALTNQLVDQRRPIGTAAARAGIVSASNSRNYRKHGSYLPDRRWRADLA
jgi:hypothetical protein